MNLQYFYIILTLSYHLLNGQKGRNNMIFSTISFLVNSLKSSTALENFVIYVALHYLNIDLYWN